MKVGVLTNAFNEERFIKGCIDQWPTNFPHIVLVGSKPWHGDIEPDNTHAIAAHNGAEVEVGVWASAQEQLNYGLSLFEGFDWVIICDADERYERHDIKELCYDLQEWVGDPIDAVRTNEWEVYWKSKWYRIEPKQTDFPLIAIRPSASFGHIRSFAGKVGWTKAKMHHFSYVRTDEEMLKKITCFDASQEFNAQQWYKSVWLKWTPEMENLHPVVPSQFKRAVFDSNTPRVTPISA